MTSPSTRDRYLRDLAREQIATAVEDDLNGESIMKEVWEQCQDDREQLVVEDEMRMIIIELRSGLSSPQRRVT